MTTFLHDQEGGFDLLDPKQLLNAFRLPIFKTLFFAHYAETQSTSVRACRSFFKVTVGLTVATGS
jgi:hypothetical protein